MFQQLKNGEKLQPIVKEVEKQIAEIHKEIDGKIESNQFRVLQSFQKHRVSDSHFIPTTGYGYDDIGRDTLELVYADVFGGEAGLVRTQIISGTHAISIALFGVLRPGDELLYITGKPYDTLEEIVGIRGNGVGSLKEFGISYDSVSLTDEGAVDWEAVEKKIKPNTKMIGIQRSKGYATRPSFTIAEIKEMISFVKEIKNDVVVFVDNCYGEFVEELEPCHVGADLPISTMSLTYSALLFFIHLPELMQKPNMSLTPGTKTVSFILPMIFPDTIFTTSMPVNCFDLFTSITNYF
jgi:cystathionine beta-lyase family protein involved in aluminum resistance